MVLALAPIIAGLILAVLATLLLVTEVAMRMTAAAGRLGILAFRRR